MPLEIVIVPCRSDNYAYLVHDAGSGATAVIDAPDAAPIAAEIARRGWVLSDILITHHHNDHIDGVEALRGDGVRVVGARADARRLPPLDLEVAHGDRFHLGAHEVQVIDVSGHTVGHIAYHIPDAQAVFTADSLMALGCGRLFEGTAPMMWASLSRLAALPGETRVYSGHEYTAANARFALTIEPDNPDLQDRARAVDAARAAGQPTVPSTIAEERATNPFLRAALPAMKEHLDMSGSADEDVFAEIRARKDRF